MDEYITIGELVTLLAIFVGPFVLAGAFIQYQTLRRTGISRRSVAGIVAAGILVTTAITVGLWYVPWGATYPPLLGFGGPLVPRALVATTVVTGMIRWYSHRRIHALNDERP